ncbi:hypothetical protein BN1049_01154 [Pseudomonas saudimassiliensis]|uniref:Uncharacterized protein n=1 Tax=Pseudomonas saudimassiliensis TaxID=1461581 RepID=A0A078MBE8_9PSED|nr:hypothetical protein [Pseudomonas saudimassiliensis]CEA03549.1 hypothetical protein BN1049_01154 [Pseudomonas saudimassiliensis]CEF26227.1 hypothetical protein BN1049_01154 [Pseudomonas saudimassiliensis]
MHSSDEAPDDAFAHEKLLEAVENQLIAGEPPATQATLNKLTLVGYEREEILSLMAQVLAHHINLMLEQDAPFDLQGYEQSLRNLPDLP